MTARPQESVRTGIVRRTRTALGDIGNRVTQKENVATVGVIDKQRGRILGKPHGPAFNNSRTVAAAVGLTMGLPSGNKLRKRIGELPRPNSFQLSSQAGRRVVMGSTAVFRSKSAVGQVKHSSSTSISTSTSATLIKVQEGFIPAKANVVVVVGDEKALGAAAAGEPTDKVIAAAENAAPKTSGPSSADGSGIDSLAQAFSSQRFGLGEGDSAIKDIDSGDVGEFMMTEYAKDIDQYLHTLETFYPITEDFLKDRSVNSRMRAVLLDWIVDVHNQFRLCQETLYLAVRLLDRFLQTDKAISRNQLQLAGITALFIAVKFEEVCVPAIMDFASVSDNAFTPAEVRFMEIRMLKALKFDVSSPIPTVFLRRCSKALNLDVNSYVMAKFITELSILDYGMCHIYPSKLAAAAVALSIMVINSQPIQTAWNQTAIHYSRYRLDELKPVIKILISALSRPYLENEQSRYQASLNKYARSNLMRISKHPCLEAAGWKSRVMNDLINL